MEKLVLFDIDGTLMDPGEAGARSMTKTLYELFPIKDAFAGIRMAGKTDIQIINNKRKHLNPGIVELLNELIATDGYWLGLLTGNIDTLPSF